MGGWGEGEILRKYQVYLSTCTREEAGPESLHRVPKLTHPQLVECVPGFSSQSLLSEIRLRLKISF